MLHLVNRLSLATGITMTVLAIAFGVGLDTSDPIPPRAMVFVALTAIFLAIWALTHHLTRDMYYAIVSPDKMTDAPEAVDPLEGLTDIQRFQRDCDEIDRDFEARWRQIQFDIPRPAL